MKHTYLKTFVFLQIFIFITGACASNTPETITIQETVVVELPVTIEVTRLITRVIEVPATITNDKAEPTTTQTPTPEVKTTPTPFYYQPYPYGSYTNIPEIDEIARLVLTRDTTALRKLIRFQSKPCIHKNDPWGPYCNEDEPVGTLVEAFPYAVCEGFLTQDEEAIMFVLEELVSQATGVYAVYEYMPNSYGIIFTSTNNENALTVMVEDGGISDVFLGCNTSPDEQLEGRDEFIILPPVATDK
ncbi:MAG: hypothetical protein H6667_23150 [Ardenticatenaceae bacterium]|nr:hypothetical protein [Ardenticatenaceae bacterium]MCB9446237.1 hypothetical protein [Ardenticatenaceae bacterium]